MSARFLAALVMTVRFVSSGLMIQTCRTLVAGETLSNIEVRLNSGMGLACHKRHTVCFAGGAYMSYMHASGRAVERRVEHGLPGSPTCTIVFRSPAFWERRRMSAVLRARSLPDPKLQGFFGPRNRVSE
jgi:hypothetical protein